MKTKEKLNKGITLVALVITIIILLILAGISIQGIINNNLMKNATTATEKYNKEQAREKLIQTLNLLSISRYDDKNYNDKEFIDNQLKKDGMSIDKDDVVTIDRYKFKIDRVNLKIIEDVGMEELTDFEKLQASYVQEGLVCWYDGIYNTVSGHDENATIWQDLTGNNNNGKLMNIDNDDNSGWSSNSLILDGINDWVQMTQIPASENGITVEIVLKLINETQYNCEPYIENVQYGGISLQKIGHKNCCAIYSGEYKRLYDDEDVKVNQLYSMSTGINKNTSTMYFSNNDIFKTNEVTEKYSEPKENTIFAIGTDPKGNSYSLSDDEKRPNMQVYSVRIYNRCLTKEEVKKNYEQDKKRFEIEKLTNNNPTPKELGYVDDGLVCMYDGEYNSEFGKSKKIRTWYDLSRNNNNGTLRNFNFNNISGWTGNSLIFDGKNDWVTMKYFSYDNMTIELVTKLLDEKKGSLLTFMANFENGGIGMERNSKGYMLGNTNVAGSYIEAVSSDIFEKNKKYSLTTRYDGLNVFYRENDKNYSIAKSGVIKKPEKSTVFALGVNPLGTNNYDGSANNNFEIYSVRIYNRALTDEEIYKNYNVDKNRFKL